MVNSKSTATNTLGWKTLRQPTITEVTVHHKMPLHAKRTRDFQLEEQTARTKPLSHWTRSESTEGYVEVMELSEKPKMPVAVIVEQQHQSLPDVD